MDKITSKELLKLMDCRKKFQLDNLALQGTDKKPLFFKRAVRKMVERYAKDAPWEEVGKELKAYLEKSYQEEWFLLNRQKEKTIEREIALMERLWKWLPAKRAGLEIKCFQSVEVECGMELNDECIRTIAGCADLLISEGGRLQGYVFCRKFSRPYSYRARKEENKVSGSIELLTLYEGLKQSHPEAESIEVSLVRLVSPADKPDCLADFEGKRGENVVTLDRNMVKSDCPDGIANRIKSLAEGSNPVACEDCRYHGVCRKTNKVYRSHGMGPKDGREGAKIRFSEAQQEIISHKEGPLRVCAGPGSGKTAVLVKRVKNLIDEGVPPERILAVTYTNKAAQEMAERIGLDGPVVSTLHAFAFGVLTRMKGLVGTVKLAGKADCKNLLVKILDYAPTIQGVSYDGLTMKYGLVSTLMKDFEYVERHGEAAFASAFPKKDAVGILRVKQIYDEAFRANGYITYDDQITMATRILRECPDILTEVRSMHEYIMVDEVQDLDEEQAEFVSLLAGEGKPNLMICGDSDQSIYGFRGGSNRYMLEFLQKYPEARDIWLEENYRSSKEIVDAASKLISQNRQRVPVEMKATYGTGFKAIHIPCFQERHMPELIREICSKGYSYGDIAIIAKTNAQLNKLLEIAEAEAALSGSAVPMEQPKYYLQDDFMFQLLLNLLELKIKGINRDEAMYRVLSWMGIEVEKVNKSLCIYEDYLSRNLIYAFDGNEASRYYLPENRESHEPLIKAFGNIYMGLQALNLPVKQAVLRFWEIFSEEDLNAESQDLLLDLIYEKKVKNIQQLYEIMKAMEVFGDDKRIYYQDAVDAQVHLLTGHDAKGKEFPVVIIYEIDEFESGDTEEDRRLLYVAMTRAKRVLFLLESYPGKSAALKTIQDCIAVNRRLRYEE